MLSARAVVKDLTRPPVVRKQEIEDAARPVRSDQVYLRFGKSRNGAQRIRRSQPQQLVKIVELAHAPCRSVINHCAEPINSSGYSSHRCQRDLLRFELCLLIRIKKRARLSGFLSVVPW